MGHGVSPLFGTCAGDSGQRLLCWSSNMDTVCTVERVRLWGTSSSLLVAQLYFPCCSNWIILKSAISVSLLSPKLSYKYCSLTITQLPDFTPEMAVSECQVERWSLRATRRLVEGVKHLERGLLWCLKGVFCFVLWFFFFLNHHHRGSRSLAPPEHEEHKPKRHLVPVHLNAQGKQKQWLWLFTDSSLPGLPSLTTSRMEDDNF